MQIPTSVQFLQGVENIPELLEEAEIDDYRKGAMSVIQEAHPETWPETYRNILVSRSSILWDTAYRGLSSQKDYARIDSAFKEVSREREAKPENFAWFCRSGVLGRIPSEVLNHTRVDFLEYMFIQLDKLGSERGTQNLGTDARLLAGKVRQIILTELGENMKKLFEEGGITRTRQILGLVSHNRGLTEAQRFTVETLAYTVFPKLDVAEEKKPHQDENSIWVTENGLRKRRDELYELLQVELPQVARDIGKAKEFGDLSENAEYTASLEKQAQLAVRAAAIEEELKKAKVIDSDIIVENAVSIGTRVTLRNTERGFMETYTILGPWDADSEQNIVSYRAALAQGLIGCKQGEERTIDLPDGLITYEVMAIVEAV
jgi:transcription elongation factor GreA